MERLAQPVSIATGMLTFLLLAQTMSPMHVIESAFSIAISGFVYWKISKAMQKRQ